MKHAQGAVLDRQLNFLVTVNVLAPLAGVSIAGVSFVSVDNLQSMSSKYPTQLGLLAIGVAITMVSGNGGIDLSGIAVANLSGIVAALTVPQLGPAGRLSAGLRSRVRRSMPQRRLGLRID